MIFLGLTIHYFYLLIIWHLYIVLELDAFSSLAGWFYNRLYTSWIMLSWVVYQLDGLFLVLYKLDGFVLVCVPTDCVFSWMVLPFGEYHLEIFIAEHLFKINCWVKKIRFTSCNLLSLTISIDLIIGQPVFDSWVLYYICKLITYTSTIYDLWHS